MKQQQQQNNELILKKQVSFDIDGGRTEEKLSGAAARKQPYANPWDLLGREQHDKKGAGLAPLQQRSDPLEVDPFRDETSAHHNREEQVYVQLNDSPDDKPDQQSHTSQITAATRNVNQPSFFKMKSDSLATEPPAHKSRQNPQFTGGGEAPTEVKLKK